MTKQEYLQDLPDLSVVLLGGRGEALAYRPALETLATVVPLTEAFVTTTMPRGWLQLAQPANLSEVLQRAYGKQFHAEDRLSWSAILRQRPVRGRDAFGGAEGFAASSYLTEFLAPHGLRYAVAVPLTAPVLDGYPGALHVYRTEEQGEFTDAEVEALAAAARQLDDAVAQHRAARERACGPSRSLTPAPLDKVAVLDASLHEQTAEPVLSGYDPRVRDQLTEHARRRLEAGANGSTMHSERLQVPDGKGDLWTFRVVTYHAYPALGDRPHVVISRLPSCSAWSTVRPHDFAADPELSRLVPALQFMQSEFHRSPTLGEIAKQVHLSPFHFHRRFAELFGLTPKHFLLECQIHAAKQQLLARQKELSQIATDCGFAHQSHFTSRFKQATGLTPTRWRRLAMEAHPQHPVATSPTA